MPNRNVRREDDRTCLRVALLVVLAAALSANALGQSIPFRLDPPTFQEPVWNDDPTEPSRFRLAQAEVEDILRELEKRSDEDDPPSGSGKEPKTPETEPDDRRKKSATESDSAESDEDGRLGEAPEDTSQLFLRQATVLLAPGEMQFDHGLTYAVSEVITPVFLSDGSLATQRLRNRQWLIPFSFRFGVKEKVQGFVDLPFGYSLTELADREQDDSQTAFGLGDVSAGLSMQLKREQGNRPDVIGTISFSAPTGDDPFGVGVVDPALGSGFWRISANVNAVKSYDPVVLFAGVGYSHFFGRTFLGNEIQLGESISYAFGMGMAVSDEITLSASLAGTYQFDTRVNGDCVPRTSIEPISLRLAITGSMFKCHIVEPFVRLGLTNDAADANFGLIITRL
ncbi:MAG: transporter [Planctomycetes bacterium]|nr:transporter [Planctomycetota bacterium]